MKRIVSLAIILLFSACGGNSIMTDTDNAVNSGTAIYKYGETLYYCDESDGIYNIKSDREDENVIETLPINYAVSSIVVDDTKLYYSCFNLSDFDKMQVKVIKKDIKSDTSEIIFEMESGGLPALDDFISISENKIYYFYPQSGLWQCDGSNSKCILSDIDDCVINGNDIYYSSENSIFKRSISNETTRCVISKDIVQKEASILEEIASGCIKNMLIHNNELYFLITDDFSGDIFKVDLNTNKLIKAVDEFRAHRFVIDNNKIYIYGTNRTDGVTGLFEINKTGKKDIVTTERIPCFYVNNGIYYYTQETENIVVIS